ncbi:MAG: single-stranded-DNA-specific exonuclease RecJ [Candidatus Pacebacteria bacterium]|nr:single-stranded-DNA-specific exonuclease RecJ [Candidatus Paceibacterota bacterium]
MNWKIKSKTIPQDLDQLQALLLENRQIDNQKLFFNPVDPSEIKLKQVGIDPAELEKAVGLVHQAIEQDQKVVIFGDYDADGITAASVLWLTLNHLGLQAQPFIPKREEHGYGITQSALEEIISQDKPDLIITVDNGIVANEAVRFARDQGIEVIVTDHHQPGHELPPASALVHSTAVAGAAVAWFLARGLDEKYATKLLDLVGIATIADQMPLVDFNRSFAVYGLRALEKSSRPGLLALMEVSGIDQTKLDSFSIGFGLAPRINAAGRLTHGLTAMRLLCTGNLPAAKKIARQLNQVNQDRQDVTKKSFEQALNLVKNQYQHNILIAASKDFHEGVIGLVAGKLTERFYKPAIAISLGKNQAKGSARSVTGVNITQLLRQVSEHLDSVGGHELAAGFSLKPEKLDSFQQALSELALKQIEPGLLEQEQQIECILPSGLVDFELVKLIDQLAPFGMANLPPIFVLEELEVLDSFSMGRDNKHLRLSLKTTEGQVLKAVGWYKAKLLDQLEPGTKLKLATAVELNHWKGRTNLQLKIKDIQVE